MGKDDQKAFDFDIPVVTSRREFFEQEAVVAEHPDELAADLEPDEVVDSLKSMREAATERTAGTGDADPDDSSAS